MNTHTAFRKLILSLSLFVCIGWACKNAYALEKQSPSEMLRSAINTNNINLAKQAIRAGVNVNVRLGWGTTHFERELETTTKEQDRPTALILAIFDERPAIVELLLKQGANPNLQESTFGSALVVACRKNSLPIVSLLLQKNASTKLTDKNGQTALHWAVLRNNKEVVVQLLLAKSPVNTKDNFGRTPLMIAKQSGLSSIVKLFLKYKADKK